MVTNMNNASNNAYNDYINLLTALEQNNYSGAEALLTTNNNLKQFLKYNDIANNALLRVAITNGMSTLAKKIIDFGVDLTIEDAANRRTPLVFAAEYNCYEIIDYLIEKGAEPNDSDLSGHTALYWSVVYQNTENIKTLIGAGANVNVINELGESPIIIAAEKGNTYIMKLLVNAGADLNVLDFYGNTLLNICATLGHKDTVSYLVKQQINVNNIDKEGNTALIKAAILGKTKIMNILIKEGVNLNAQNNYGQTALNCAAYSGNVTNVKILINAGANIFIKDKEERTPLNWAQYNKNTEIIDTIYNYVLSDTLECVLTAATASDMIFDIAFMIFKTTLQKNMIDAGEKTYNISNSKTHAKLYTQFRDAATEFVN